MALCKEEGTKEEVLRLFGKGGVMPGYVVIQTWEIQKEAPGHTVCHYSATYRAYGSKEAYLAEPDNFFNAAGIGGPIPADACSDCDDRDVIYPYMQAEIQRQNLWRKRDAALIAAEGATDAEKKEIIESFSSQISAVYDMLNIREI